jgi:hypothetical protein
VTVAKSSLRQVDRQANESMSAIEAKRRIAVKIVFLIYILMLVEGPLRKWFVPELATPVYFLRDPVVLFLYAYCLHARLITFDIWARLWFIFAALTSLIGIIPFMLGSVDVRAWALGVRTYWLYMPLAFVIASTFRCGDLLRFFRLNILLAIPYAALIIAQYQSPLSAWINAGIGGDESVVTYAPDMVRPYGLFTYTGQNVNFSATVVAIFLSYILIRNPQEKSRLLWLTSAGAIGCLPILSGSRAIYFLIGASLFVTLAGLNLMKDKISGVRATLIVACCVALAAFMFVYAFPDAYEGMQNRLERAERSEGPIQNRAISEFFSFLWPLETAPVLGHGIGIGAPAVGRFLGRPPQEFGESDMMRNVNELGPVFGLMFVALRYGFGIYLVVISLRAARVGHPEFLPLGGLASLGITRTLITNSTLNGFPYWLVAGLVLAAVPVIRASTLSATSPEPVLRKPWTPRSRSMPATIATATRLRRK